MATLAVGVAGASGGGLTATFGPWGAFFAVLGASLIDSQLVMPGLSGRGNRQARPTKLAGIPTGSNDAGAPRIWALGNRIRVPCHVLFQSSKTRETQSNQKDGSQITMRRVFIDALIALNDRETASLQQLIGNGSLLLWRSRNLTDVTTSGMSVAQDGARITITMASTEEVPFTDDFAVGNIVRLSGFVPATSTPDPNGTYWRVQALANHATGAPSTMTLDPVQGQTVTGVSATGGSPFAPARVERIDDAAVDEMTLAVYHDAQTNLQLRSTAIDFADVFEPSNIVQVNGLQSAVTPSAALFPGWTWRVTRISALAGGVSEMWLHRVSFTNLGSTGLGQNPSTLQNISATNICRVEFADHQSRLLRSMFPPGFNPDDHYYPGDDTQVADHLLIDIKGTDSSPAYRGTAYQGLDQFEVTRFGNALPFGLEAIIDPDPGMEVSTAFRTVLERYGIPSDAIDVSGVSTRPFGGMYIRGTLPASTALQPMLIAYQVVDQDRNGVLCLFEIDEADVVQIENGAVRTALGARREGDTVADDKIARRAVAMEDLPTSLGVRHQDPDNAYADGYQHFGLRNPTGVDWQNDQELDLSTLVLSRKEARNLATTMMRRTWINSEVFEATLDGRYMDLLENDIVTVTTDEGEDLTLRLTEVEIGANFLVRIVGVREQVNLAVHGSPVQRETEARAPLVQAAELEVAVLDLPALSAADTLGPVLRIAAGATPGSVWQGARLFESRDGGLSWVDVGMLPQQAAIGTHAGMATGTAAETYGATGVTLDGATTLEVELTSLGLAGGLTSCTQAEAQFSGVNWCAIEDATTGRWEVAAFTVATQTATRTWELSGWLRGLRGTHVDAARAKASGGRFVLLSGIETAAIRREIQDPPQGLSLLYRAVPVGASLESVDSVGITPTWQSVTPLPPRKLTATIGSSPYDVTIETENWTRQPLPLGQVGPYPMDEEFEEYVFTLWNPGGTAQVRTRTLSVRNAAGQVVGSPTLRDRFIVFTAAELTAAGYTPGPSETFIVDVQQVGSYQTRSASDPREIP